MASLSIHNGTDGKALVFCHAGCNLEAVLSALGRSVTDLFEAPSELVPQKAKGRPLMYQVRAADGRVVAIHERHPGKGFAWRRPDGTPGLNGTRTTDLPLFGAEHVGTWDASRPVVVAEGEKAAMALLTGGFRAVGTVTGASSTPNPEPLAVLKGHEVILWPDADDAGRQHMRRIAQRLEGIAGSVRVVDWPEAPPHGDAADTDPVTMAALLAGARSAAEFLSDHPKTDVWSETKLPWLTAAELSASIPSEPDWVVTGYLVAGGITELGGKVKAAGKTTLVTYLIQALVNGDPFLDQPTTQTGVVYLTEQARSSFREALRRAQLDASEAVEILCWPEVRGLAWSEMVAAAVARAEARNARVLVIDTLGQWSGIEGEGENAAGEALRALEPLQRAAAGGLAVLIVRHERKSGGEVGEAARGSSAFGGAVDIVLSLRRPEGSHDPHVRHLESLSRYDATPESVVIELTEAGYVVRGTRADYTLQEAKAAVLDVLPGAPGWTEAELAEHLEETPRSTRRRALVELVEAGTVRRTGAGKRGNPYRYSTEEEGAQDTPQSPEIVSDQTSFPSGQKESNASEASVHAYLDALEAGVA